MANIKKIIKSFIYSVGVISITAGIVFAVDLGLNLNNGDFITYNVRNNLVDQLEFNTDKNTIQDTNITSNNTNIADLLTRITNLETQVTTLESSSGTASGTIGGACQLMGGGRAFCWGNMTNGACPAGYTSRQIGNNYNSYACIKN